MRFRTLESFRGDHKKLKIEHRSAFAAVVRAKFAPACDAWSQARDAGKVFVWPASLRVTELVGGRGVMEMTWSFASPDGRATFVLIREDGEWICVWRRIGDHGVYADP